MSLSDEDTLSILRRLTIVTDDVDKRLQAIERKAMVLVEEKDLQAAIKELREYLDKQNDRQNEMIEHVIRTIDPAVSYKAVRASRGKAVRAEPVAALDEQGRVHHVGAFAELEDQMCAMTPEFDRAAAGFSPDRVDARVWAITELMLHGQAGEPRVRGL